MASAPADDRERQGRVARLVRVREGRGARDRRRPRARRRQSEARPRTAANSSSRICRARAGWRSAMPQHEFFTNALAFVTASGARLDPTTLTATLRDATKDAPASGHVEFDRLQIEPLRDLAAHLPLPEKLRVDLARFAPRGTLTQGRVRWEGPARRAVRAERIVGVRQARHRRAGHVSRRERSHRQLRGHVGGRRAESRHTRRDARIPARAFRARSARQPPRRGALGAEGRPHAVRRAGARLRQRTWRGQRHRDVPDRPEGPRRNRSCRPAQPCRPRADPSLSAGRCESRASRLAAREPRQGRDHRCAPEARRQSRRVPVHRSEDRSIRRDGEGPQRDVRLRARLAGARGSRRGRPLRRRGNDRRRVRAGTPSGSRSGARAR